MANHCYNDAHIEGTEQMIDLFIQRLEEAKKEEESLYNPTFYKALGQEPTNEDVYNQFGSRWFDANFERFSPTSMSLCGDSAWTPINEFLLRLSAVYGFTIASTYEESGEDFGGWFSCTNGEVTLDKSTSYYAFRYLDDREHTMETMLEDVTEGYWESVDYLDLELLEIMREKDRVELIEAVNKYIAEQG
jgi:hypothetical protein